MANDNDDDDYMSNIFVQEEPHHISQLAKPLRVDRKRKLECRKFNGGSQTKPRKIIEQESRNKGLDTALGSDNVGFKLMSKMGYKSGQGLGAQNDGRAEPVPITVKAGRTGLGRDAAVRDAQERRQKFRIAVQQKKAVLEKVQRSQFRGHMKEVFGTRRAEKDLYKSQAVCYDLDSNHDVMEPSETFFWPADVTRKENEEEIESTEDECSTSHKLCLLTNYLRQKYLYCVWCGIGYNDAADLKSNCPGDTAIAHDEL